jgi:tetratricopeptide (TPR) repeat protein
LSLVEEVGGLPLALTLLGKYLQSQAHSGQPRRLQAALARLRSSHQRLHVSEMRGPLEQPPHLAWGTPLSLQSAIAVSDQQLDEQAREVLRALSVFPPKPNSFSEEAALAVAQAPPETLDALVDAGLLESSGAGRYLLHQTIADYASAHLRDPQAGERLVAYVTGLLERHGNDDAALELESRNIVAGLQYAFENGRHARFIRGVLAFAPFLRRRGFYDLARLYLQRAYQIAIWSSDAATQGRLLLGLGEVALHQGDLKAAGGYLREALVLVREGRLRREWRRVLRLLRYLAWRQGEVERAADYGRELAMLAAEEAGGDG